MELSRQIKRHRAERGLSQEDLAAAIYVSRQTVSNWETDRTYPDVENLLLLSALFDVTIDELVKGDVEAMKKTISKEARRLRLWTCVMAACGIAALASILPSIKTWGLARGAILPAILLALSVVACFFSTRISKSSDVETLREIVAFVKGEPIERSAAERARDRKRRVRAAVFGMIAAAVIGSAIGYLAAPWIFG